MTRRLSILFILFLLLVCFIVVVDPHLELVEDDGSLILYFGEVATEQVYVTTSGATYDITEYETLVGSWCLLPQWGCSWK